MDAMEGLMAGLRLHLQFLGREGSGICVAFVLLRNSSKVQPTQNHPNHQHVEIRGTIPPGTVPLPLMGQ